MLIWGRAAQPPKSLVLALHFKVHSLLPKGLILYCKVEFCAAAWYLSLLIIKLMYCICIVENMGVVSYRPRPYFDTAPRAPMLKFLDINTAVDISDV